jgi:CRP-like cAMP-binding protein
MAAAREAPGVIASPAPFARTRAFAESSTEYEVLFYIDDFAHAQDIEGAVRDRIYYALARHGLDVPYPTRTLLLGDSDGNKKRQAEDLARRAKAIAAASLMERLPEDARQVLAARSALRPYGPGEVIVRKGDRSTELFVIERGSVGVEVPRDGGGAAEVTQLGVGQCFGEMGLLTGEVRSATVRAKVLSHLVVIDHDAFHEVLAGHPEVVELMGTLLARRQAELSAVQVASGRSQAPEERSRRLISQIREFFKLV